MRISRSLQIVMLSTIALGLQSRGHAQTNLVNLYNFTGETQNGYSPNQGIAIGSNFLLLYCAYGTNGPPGLGNLIEPILTGNINTTPGATYEISYTVEHGPPDFYSLHAVVSFGNISIDSGSALLAAERTNSNYGASLNYEYSYIATSTTTAMTFVGGFIDEADSVLFNNVSVIEVPEMSAASLLGLGGCVWLLAPPWRRSFQNRKRN